ncbi:SWIM zinc finger family protein [Alicyclobacillus herbarius]|uniref:SWIM zinc finger family protein n=1 Tax=Alicyclobacillus herbarius TaxID=122960 RepID=UPI000407F096|nr:SWIM zinc finger family protein [Alicyclobacillus herbarius]
MPYNKKQAGKGVNAASGTAAYLESLWKPVFDDVDRVVWRRARALAVDGVLEWGYQEGMVTARVRGHGPAAHQQAHFPLVDDWRPHRRIVAAWFFLHPDWLAGLMRGHLASDFLAAIHQEGMDLFPTDSYVTRFHHQASCTCGESVLPCTHVLAAVLAWLRALAEDPVQLLASVQLDTEWILNEAHRLTHAWVQRESGSLDSPARSNVLYRPWTPQPEIDRIQPGRSEEAKEKGDRLVALSRNLSLYLPVRS